LPFFNSTNNKTNGQEGIPGGVEKKFAIDVPQGLAVAVRRCDLAAS
jgi:hypothetical protein